MRARFDFDQRIHAERHQKAREARAAFLAGKTPTGAKLLRISRKPDKALTTEELLEKSRAEAAGPRPIGGEKKESKDSALAIDPEMAQVLERELKKPGDVTTILEERERFSVFRLLSRTESEWSVLAYQIPKRNFEMWFEDAKRKFPREAA